jgi:hypothetical protein
VTALLLDPGTFQVASPELQDRLGGDPIAAGRFPNEARLPAVTPAMGLFTVTEEQLASMVDRAREGIRRRAERAARRMTA